MKKQTFESAIARLEEIITLLDSGEAELEKSLAYYAESAELLAFCNKTIDEAELKVKTAFPKPEENIDE